MSLKRQVYDESTIPTGVARSRAKRVINAREIKFPINVEELRVPIIKPPETVLPEYFSEEDFEILQTNIDKLRLKSFETSIGLSHFLVKYKVGQTYELHAQSACYAPMRDNKRITGVDVFATLFNKVARCNYKHPRQNSYDSSSRHKVIEPTDIEREIGMAYLSYVLSPEESPWRSILHPEYRYKGQSLIDPEYVYSNAMIFFRDTITSHACSLGQALRNFDENHNNARLWYELVQRGVPKTLAFLVHTGYAYTECNNLIQSNLTHNFCYFSPDFEVIQDAYRRMLESDLWIDPKNNHTLATSTNYSYMNSINGVFFHKMYRQVDEEDYNYQYKHMVEVNNRRNFHTIVREKCTKAVKLINHSSLVPSVTETKALSIEEFADWLIENEGNIRDGNLA